MRRQRKEAILLMLALYEFAGHNDDMRTELDPVQKEVLRTNPDWITVAWRIQDQPGCENFPVSTVERILDKPGELIVGTVPSREEVFSIGAIIAAKKRPFSPFIGGLSEAGPITGLRIEPQGRAHLLGPKGEETGETLESARVAEREISFGLGNNGFYYPNWVGAGIGLRADGSNMTILDADTPAPELAIGTDEVNAFFEKLVHEERFATRKDRLLGMLFQTARLALDFNAPTPTAPRELQTEIDMAKEYYKRAQVLTPTIADARTEVLVFANALSNLRLVPRPAIHYDEPLQLPDANTVRDMARALTWMSDSDVREAHKSYSEAIETLNALRTKQ